MHHKGKNRIGSLPSPLAGLALGTSGLGTALELAFPTGFWIPAVFLLAVPMVCLVLAKLVSFPDIRRSEASHPVLGAMPVACSMVLMSFAQVLRPLLPVLSHGIWFSGLFLAVAGCLSYFLHRYRAGRREDLLPSCFLALGGLLVSEMTVPFSWLEHLTHFLMVCGDLAFFVLLPFVFIRAVRGAPLPPAVLPVLAIFAAPANLVIVSWLSAHPSVPAWGWPVIVLALLLNVWIYAWLPRLMAVPFTPALAALTFPMSITATAALKLSVSYPFLRAVAFAETGAAVAVVLFVLARYGLFFLDRSARGQERGE